MWLTSRMYGVHLCVCFFIMFYIVWFHPPKNFETKTPNGFYSVFCDFHTQIHIMHKFINLRMKYYKLLIVVMFNNK